MKSELKNAMDALNVKTPLRLNGKAPAFRAPMPINSQEVPAKPSDVSVAVLGGSTLIQPNGEERGSNLDSVQNEQGSNLTLSKMDTVQNEPSEKRRGSNLDPVGEQTSGAGDSVERVRANFTIVPHELLRGPSKFSDPLDFMIYLHFYTFSLGYGRSGASMGQGQLERFTGAARNTVRRSLERLIKEGWLKLVDEYEHGRVTRRWRVTSPEENGKKKGKATGVKMDTVQNEQGSDLTQRGFKIDPLTGSKIDPYKESIHTEVTKNSLSSDSAELQAYFDSILAFRKRESEFAAYLGLKRSVPDEQIALCVNYLGAKGIPGSGQPCHSPMAYLAKAIGQVLPLAVAEREKHLKAETREQAANEQRQQEAQMEREAEVSAQNQEIAFCAAFPNLEDQEAIVAQFAMKYPIFSARGPALRSLAVAEWYSLTSPSQSS